MNLENIKILFKQTLRLYYPEFDEAYFDKIWKSNNGEAIADYFEIKDVESDVIQLVDYPSDFYDGAPFQYVFKIEQPDTGTHFICFPGTYSSWDECSYEEKHFVKPEYRTVAFYTRIEEV